MEIKIAPMALADQTTEKLLSTQKLLKSILIAYSILVFISAVVLALVKGKAIHFISPFTFFLVMLPVFINLRSISTELKSSAQSDPK